MTIFARPSEWTRIGLQPPKPRRRQPRAPHYFAFLSYSHHDEELAGWLHESLEKFRVPRHLVGKLTDNGPVPRCLTPIFRDIGELPASDDLGTEIRSSIAGSRFLIVLCSPAAAKSKWTNAEIEAFKRAHPDGCVFAAIVAGEPFASEIPGRESEECLPQALRYKYDRRGHRTGKRAEPLAADLREAGEARRMGLLKLIAGMLGLGLDELVRRETLRRHRRMAAIAGGSFVGMLIAIVLAVAAIQARDAARDQRREAEALVGFMLGDLREKLEPVGRLDVLDSVAARALAYYEKQNTGDLSDESLAQRSKALTLMGEMAFWRGDLDRAMRFYSGATAGTEEALRRAPDEPQRMFNHAQNIFWVGYIHWQREDLDRAEAAFSEYDRLARAMVAAEPTNTTWLLERSYANNNLGAVQIARGRYRQASQTLRDELRMSEGLVAIDAANTDFQDRLLEALAWLSDARQSSGALDEAVGLRRRQLAYLEQLKASRPGDASLKRKAMTAHHTMGRLLASRGETQQALASLQIASALAGEMLRTDPNNAEWAQFAAHIFFDRGEVQLAEGRTQAAVESARAGCNVARELAGRDSSVVSWRSVLPGRCLMLRIRLALSNGSATDGQALADQLSRLARNEVSRQPSPDSRVALAEAELLRGKVADQLGDKAAAQSAWEAADAAWPQNIELTPHETAIRATILQRLGRHGESRRLARQLQAIGYRDPVYAV